MARMMGMMWGGLFEPDVVNAGELRASVRSDKVAAAEKRLMLAVLSDAVDCYRKYFASRDQQLQRLFEEAAEWIGSENRDGPFSFLNLCETLAIDPSYLRGGLQRSQVRGRSRRYAGSSRAVSGKESANGDRRRPEL